MVSRECDGLLLCCTAFCAVLQIWIDTVSCLHPSCASCLAGRLSSSVAYIIRQDTLPGAVVNRWFFVLR